MHYFKKLTILFFVLLFPNICNAENWQNTAENGEKILLDIDSINYNNNSVYYNIIYFDKKLKEDVIVTIQSKKNKAGIVNSCKYIDFINNKCTINTFTTKITSNFKPILKTSVIYNPNIIAFEKISKKLGNKFNFDFSDNSEGEKAVLNTGNDINFKPYMKELQRRIKSNWEPPQIYGNHNVVVIFKIDKSGRLLNWEIKKTSGYPAVDKAAIVAIQLSAPFRPLPNEYEEDSVEIEFTFDNNVIQ